MVSGVGGNLHLLGAIKAYGCGYCIGPASTKNQKRSRVILESFHKHPWDNETSNFGYRRHVDAAQWYENSFRCCTDVQSSKGHHLFRLCLYEKRFRVLQIRIRTVSKIRTTAFIIQCSRTPLGCSSARPAQLVLRSILSHSSLDLRVIREE